MTNLTSAPNNISTTRVYSVPSREPMFAVTLFQSEHVPLFRLTTRAMSASQAVSTAERMYANILKVVFALHGGYGNRQYLFHNPNLTQVDRGAREPERTKLHFVIRTGSAKRSFVDHQLSSADAGELLGEVINADHGLLAALTRGAKIESCPYRDQTYNTGWLTIDCAFRTNDGTGSRSGLRPLSSSLREVARLIALDVLYCDEATTRMSLLFRQELACHEIASATLRAYRKELGPRAPIKLISWLHARGLHDLAADVRAVTQSLPR